MEMAQVESQFVVTRFRMKISRKHMTKQVNYSIDFEWHISWYFHFLEGNRNNAKKNQENKEEFQDTTLENRYNFVLENRNFFYGK